jgi:hypothetical protein
MRSQVWDSVTRGANSRRIEFWRGTICTSCYKDGAIEQVVKASAVRKFLDETFSPA